MDDEASLNRQRVRLSSREVIKYGTRLPKEACATLELLDNYKETFLLCHAFLTEGRSIIHDVL